LVKKKPRSRNKDGTWRKKRNDAKRIRTKGHYRSIIRDKDGKFIGAEKWCPKTRDEILDYYDTLPGKLSLRLNDPDFGLMEDDKRGFIEPVQGLMDEVEALKRQVDLLMKDNGELRIKIKAYEGVAEMVKVKDECV